MRQQQTCIYARQVSDDMPPQPAAGTSGQPICHRPSPISTPSRDSSSGSTIRFVVVSNPDQLRNPAELRLNRQHVMKDYLAKEASKPASNDPRVHGRKATRIRKRICRRVGDLPSRDGASIATGLDGSRSVARSRREDPPASGRSRAGGLPRGGQCDGAPLVTGSNGRFRNHVYLGTDAEEVPFPPQRLGGDLDPFKSWPAFDDPSLRVNELKWSCSRRFGSRGIADHWVPTLLKARHAFLSTIAISSAHDDIMSRSARPPDQRPRYESVQRARVRHEVTSMINQSMSDSEMRTSDATMVAVVHLLNAEIMGCDDGVLRVHQRGLSAMVSTRGGLGALGVHGQLAGVVTVTMYIIASTRETQPPSMFCDFAESMKGDPPEDLRPLPESPVYCGPSGYWTLYKAFAPDSHMCNVLEHARHMTVVFCAGMARSQTHRQDSDVSPREDAETKADLTTVAARIFALPPAEDLDSEQMSDRYTYEAARLTSTIYAHALLQRISFSRAAQELQARASHRSLESGTLARDAPAVEDCALHIHIRNALMRTDTSECWGHGAGVLLWITLVAGAAANPAAAPGGYVERRETGDDEDARKWLAAIAVRCSILLGFEFGPAVMETVKSLVAVQKALDPPRTVDGS
ncbi:hypothetical protein LTR53_008848 [Teratosphaeriaceae sp. CCFEE 6253]|nr:hypothetical protein LTR53_008848 [Teratosphaeriaceae sp. CCFEE 6253]